MRIAHKRQTDLSAMKEEVNRFALFSSGSGRSKKKGKNTDIPTHTAIQNAWPVVPGTAVNAAQSTAPKRAFDLHLGGIGRHCLKASLFDSSRCILPNKSGSQTWILSRPA